MAEPVATADPSQGQTSAAQLSEEQLLQALHEADAEIPDAGQGGGSSPMTPERIEQDRNSGILGAINRVVSPPKIVDAAGSGVVEAGFQAKDFVTGEPAEGDKSLFRQSHEEEYKANKEGGFVTSATQSIAQMVTGLVGVGKLMRPIKALQALRKGSLAGKAAYEVGKGAAASALVLDPHEERLSDLIENYPALQNPVTNYLSADPNDSAAEGRFKNAIESIGLDVGLAGAVKVVKLLRIGKQDEALKEIKKLGTSKDTARLVDETSTDTPPETVAALRSNTSDAEGMATKPLHDATTGAKPEGEVTDGTAYRPAELSDDDLRSILKGSADEEAAIRKYGSREAATEAGQVLSRATTLPWQKLRGTEDTMSFVNRAASVLKSQMDDAKGGAVMSDAKVSEMVHARADLFGEDPQMMMGQIQEAGTAAKDMVANMEASYLIANKMFQESYDAAFRIRNGMLDNWGGDAAAAERDLKARLTASADLLSAARSMSSNSGRALRRMRGQFQFKPEDLASIKDLDGQKLADLIFQTKGDPKRLAQVANPTFLRRVMDEATFSLTNSLLWLWPTHVTNITSSALMLMGRPTEKLLGSFAVGPKSGGDILRQQAIREYGYTVASMSDAWTAMKDAFLRGDSLLSPHNTEFFAGGAAIRTAQQPLPWRPVTSISDLVHNAWVSANYRNIVGLPTRSLGAVDEFFKTLRYRAYIQAEAATKANQAGLKGEDFATYVKQKMEEAIDPATGQALDQNALREAQITTFQQDLLEGTAGATIQQVRSRHPVLTFVVPFVKTPVNVLRYSWKMTPGLNLLQKEFRDNLRGVNGAEMQAHAYGQMTLGTTAMALTAMMALSGKMTGAGPNDPKFQKELRSTGWQPYAYVIDRPDGSKKYIPMGRLDPVSMVMTMTADLTEALRHDPESSEAEKGIGALGIALAKNFSDKTFLQNIHQAIEALSDDKGDKGEKYLASIAGNTIPLSSGLRGINPDPYLREARTFVDMMLKDMPGYSSTLPPTRDAFGEPMARRIGLTTSSKPQAADIVEAENSRLMLETGKGVHKPDPSYEGVDLRDITLKSGRNAYDRYQELSGQLPGQKSIKDYLASLIQSESYQDMPDGSADVQGTRLHALGMLTTPYRKAAIASLVQENPELSEFVKARQRAARGAYLENRQKRQQGDPGAKELLEALTGNSQQ